MDHPKAKTRYGVTRACGEKLMLKVKSNIRMKRVNINIHKKQGKYLIRMNSMMPFGTPLFTANFERLTILAKNIKWLLRYCHREWVSLQSCKND